jgi:phosphoribosylformylglycinamidine synthase
MHQIAESIRGLGEGARAFDIPVVSGNVSLYNETNGVGIQPTPLLAVVGLLEDTTKAVSTTFKNDGDTIFLIGPNDEQNIGGSAYLAEVHKLERGALPELNYEREQSTCNCIRTLIDRRLLNSCHDLSQGGLGSALAESCFNDYRAPQGATLQLTAPIIRKDAALFNESGARFLVSCAPAHVAAVKDLLSEAGLTISAEGAVGGRSITVSGVATIDSQEAFKAWFNGLDAIFEG